MDVVARNQRLQEEWYGEQLGAKVRRLLPPLGLSQSAFAEVLGLSAPMLSQLMSGQRAKISNPAVLSRLLAVQALVTDPGFDRLPQGELRERIAEIRADAPPTSATLRLSTGTQPLDPVPAIQALLRALASAAEIEAAAARLESEAPGLAEFLRVYGNGRTDHAREHYANTL
ncbi:helix-turn-helix domain-containing protein [Allokutzneria sp. A3M-2-11 16]|uniref:helix-turn-helix domain-containing protein n=1 Tax=Allokutzneria sp. A3M-2-11 16 TaxID=2962043 RepID=UPI0020B84D53|nr:helix-turn-helix domain-containing protein [Allokutzneria sp. A3M-2-11 16]MCP3803695.1 helix-turn-helix domain-containing protein [Allokutzneria sp. A3M-2-11 16]